MKTVYLDIDGVLLGEADGRVVLARHAAQFIDFLTSRFDAYWLTTHCRGESQPVLNYLSRYAPTELLARLERIKPTYFEVLKTEALGGDFYWIDDSPLQSELADLQGGG